MYNKGLKCLNCHQKVTVNDPADGSDSCLQVPWNEDPPKNPVQAIQTEISELPALE